MLLDPISYLVGTTFGGGMVAIIATFTLVSESKNETVHNLRIFGVILLGACFLLYIVF